MGGIVGRRTGCVGGRVVRRFRERAQAGAATRRYRVKTGDCSCGSSPLFPTLSVDLPLFHEPQSNPECIEFSP